MEGMKKRKGIKKTNNKLVGINTNLYMLHLNVNGLKIAFKTEMVRMDKNKNKTTLQAICKSTRNKMIQAD